MRSPTNAGGPEFEDRFRAVVARFLSGQEQLDAAAGQLAHIWKEWAQAMERHPQRLAQPTTPSALLTLFSAGDLWPNPSADEARRVGQLIEAAVAKLA